MRIDCLQIANFLPSFGVSINALVVGANGGLGRAFVDVLAKTPSVKKIYAWTRTELKQFVSRISASVFDLHDEKAVINAGRNIDELQLVIVATGVLHSDNGLFPEKSFKAFQAADMLEILKVAVTPLKVVGVALVVVGVFLASGVLSKPQSEPAS